MAEIRVLVCDKVSNEGIDLLSKASFKVDYLPKITGEELLAKVSGYDAVIVRSRTKITKDVIAAGKRLKVVGRAGVGLDNIDVKAAEASGIRIFNTPEALTEAVAELVMGLMLSLARGICRGDGGLRRGEWLKNELLGSELKGKTLGVIGMGKIGRRVAELAGAFGMKILFNDIVEIPRGIVEALSLEFRGLDELLAESDYVTLHVPLTPDTKHMIDRSRLSKMKRTAYLINTSRGMVVDESALLEALRNGVIRGAALDVFEEEPPVGSELVKLPGVVCTPHIGAQTVEAQDIAANILAEKVVAHFKVG